jgi:hypothetical protein
MLAQQTGQNVANQAALMAGQRGAGANTGLIARQAAQQGAATQQQAAGQGATLQAQQSLNALNQLGGVAGQQVSQQQQALTQQNALQQAQQQATLGQGNTQQQLATQQAQAQQNALLNALQAQNQANVASQGSINSANAGAQTVGAQSANNLFGTALGGVTSGISTALHLAKGGTAEKKAYGGESVGDMGGSEMTPMPRVSSANNPKSAYALLSKQYPSMYAKGGKVVDVILSPGEKVLPPQVLKAQNAKELAAEFVKKGKAKTVPGQAEVGGAKNDYANDTYRTKLAEGSVVLPRSVTKSKAPVKATEKFVAALKAKKKAK